MMRTPSLQLNRRAKGMAMIAVLWVVAALSILVTGMSRATRGEIRAVSAQSQAVQSQAIGDAAITLALQELTSNPTRPSRGVTGTMSYRGLPVPVQLAPLNGWIDLNGASLALLARLYQFAGGLGPDAAQQLAQSTIEAREKKDWRGQAERFEAPEDLLRIPGVGYDLYARLSPLVTVYGSTGGGARVNPLAAPLGVLMVLANGDEAVARRIVQQREAGAEGIDTTSLDASLVSVSSVRRYRVEAAVPLSDGGVVRVARIVDVGASARDGLAWRTLHAERSIEPMSR
ncbi:general secretion pathway protein GspK [Acidovorax sp. NPDC077664]|uniref:general secretion pathway protein GspK n=2 Tax=unclassified Acidovorax TaxID=2684926 RepID=UPI003CFF2479